MEIKDLELQNGYTQVGRSRFVSRVLANCVSIKKNVSLREFARENSSLGRVILVPPKDRIIELTWLKKSDFQEVLLVSSLAVEVKSFSSPKFQKYRKYKLELERLVDSLGVRTQFLRLAMFIDPVSPKSWIHLLGCAALSVFVTPSRGFYYSAPHHIERCFGPPGLVQSAKPYGVIRGLGLIPVRSFVFKRMLVKAYVKKIGSCS